MEAKGNWEARFSSVFISYASEDFQYAEELYEYLSKSGLGVWMDKRNILPGQDWDFQIQTALRRADFVILLLSNVSVTKRGYVRKEFNKVIQYCEEKLDTDIYTIPVKINDCEIPEKLSKFQWVNYAEDSSFNKILDAINFQRGNLISQQKEQPWMVENQEKKFTLGTNSPLQIFEAKFFKIKGHSNESLEEVNLIVSKEVLDYIISCRSSYYDFSQTINVGLEEETMLNIDSTCFGTFTNRLITKHLVSYTSFWSIYSTGAAHGRFGTTGHNYYLNPLRPLKIESLFDDFSKSVLKLRDKVFEKLLIWAKSHEDENAADVFHSYSDGLAPEIKNFENFYFTKESIVFIYNPYHLVPWVFGDQQPEISFNELKELFPSDQRLNKFFNNFL